MRLVADGPRDGFANVTRARRQVNFDKLTRGCVYEGEHEVRANVKMIFHVRACDARNGAGALQVASIGLIGDDNVIVQVFPYTMALQRRITRDVAQQQCKEN